MNTKIYGIEESQVILSSTSFLQCPKDCVSLGGKMIRLVVKEVAMKEGISNPNELATRTGLPYESCRLMWRGTSKRIDLHSIERICTVLGVRPGQLFEFEPEANSRQEQVGKSGRKVKIKP